MQSGNYKFVYLFNKLADMVMISALWGILSLPVITMGASTSALYYAVVKAVREDKAYAAASFWSAFKTNLKQSTCFQACALAGMLAFGGTACGMLQFSGNFAANVYFIFSCTCFCIIIVIQMHGYFLIGRYEVRGKEFLSVLLKLSGRDIGHNIMMLLVFVFAAELVLRCPLSVLFVPAGFTYIISYAEEKRFEQYIRA